MKNNYLPFWRTLSDPELNDAVRNQTLLNGHEEAHYELVREKARRYFSDEQNKEYRITR